MEEKQPSARRQVAVYLTVWLALLALTGTMIALSRLVAARAAVLVVLLIAAVKAVLLLFFFMHLKDESRPVIRLLIPGVLVLLAICIGLVFSDILLR